MMDGKEIAAGKSTGIANGALDGEAGA